MNWIGGLLFLLAGLSGGREQAEMEIAVRNPSSFERKGEMVEISWKKLEDGLGSPEAGQLVVYNAEGQEIASQVIYRGGKLPVALIFQTTAAPGKEEVFYIRRGQPAKYRPLVYGRLVPERKDDFAWENRLVAYRVYGPALEATGEISNGIDVWCKGTGRLILDDWYKSGDYHRNHGEGMDAYKVGRTLGGGAMAPWQEGRLVLGNNFTTYRILDQGPLRISFLLEYAPYRVGNHQVIEQREISLDADARFCRIRETYSGSPDPMQVAAGIVLRGQAGEFLRDAQSGIMGYWEPENWDNGENNGHIGIGVVFPHPLKKIETAAGHMLAVVDYPGEAVEYFIGSAWSQRDVPDAAAWFEIIGRKKEKLENPLEIMVKNQGQAYGFKEM